MSCPVCRQVYYPFNYIMPSGDMLTFCSRFGRIIEPYTGTVKGSLPRYPGAFNAQYPYSATSVILPLMPSTNYSVCDVGTCGVCCTGVWPSPPDRVSSYRPRTESLGGAVGQVD